MGGGLPHPDPATVRNVNGSEALARLRAAHRSLPRAEARIADLVLADPRRVASLTIGQLASEAQTSQTSVLRFARRLGLSGYPGLRLALMEAWAANGNHHRQLSDLAATDSIDDIVTKVAQSNAAAVEGTARRIDRDTLGAVADALVKAHRVDLFGVAASGLVCSDLQHKLHRIGIVTHAWSDAHLALTSMSLLKPGDVVLVVSHSGTTVEAVEALEVARGVGATTVAITNAERSPVAKAAEYVLLTAANESRLRSGATASRISALVVVDILFLTAAQRDLDAAGQAVAETRRAVSKHHRVR